MAGRDCSIVEPSEGADCLVKCQRAAQVSVLVFLRSRILSNDAQRLQQSDGLESGCHAVRSPARIVRSASCPTPDCCPVTPPGSMGRCVVGSGPRTGANVSPFTSTGPPQKGHRQMVLSPIPAFSECQIAGHGEADGFDTVAEQVAKFGTSAALEAQAGAPNPEGVHAPTELLNFTNPFSLPSAYQL